MNEQTQKERRRDLVQVKKRTKIALIRGLLLCAFFVALGVMTLIITIKMISAGDDWLSIVIGFGVMGLALCVGINEFKFDWSMYREKQRFAKFLESQIQNDQNVEKVLNLKLQKSEEGGER